MEQVLDKFLRYVSFDTQSVENVDEFPSSSNQKVLGKILAQELCDMGVQDVFFDENYGYVYAKIPASKGCSCSKKIGFIAHMDTSPAASGKNIQAQLHRNYDGGALLLNEERNIYLSPKDFPQLLTLKGKDLVTTDGTTLLGADDKAGVAEIMAMAEQLMASEAGKAAISHGEIRIAFTPDEEVGRGMDFFDVEKFDADYAYTVDGGPVGELEFENFNAASARLTVWGRSTHTGDAKGKMKNAILMQQEFQSMLPQREAPMYTEGYEGFYHLDKVTGTVEKTVADYIIRDHDMVKFKEKKEKFSEIARVLNQKYGEDSFCVEIVDSYFNMREKIEPYMFLIDEARSQMEQLNIVPIVNPIRGGTDGARLSFMGVPCPNLGTGGYNYHGRFEYACVQSMEVNVALLSKLACANWDSLKN